MSLLILQTQAPEQSLAADSYGVIATAAMLDQTVSLVYCNEGVKQLTAPALREQLHSALEFGVAKLYLNKADCERHGVDQQSLVEQLPFTTIESISTLVKSHDQVLSF